MNIYLFQKGDGMPSLWEDCTCTASVDGKLNKDGNLLNAGLGEYPIRYNLFEKIENRFVLFNLKEDPTTFVIKHSSDVIGMTEMIFNIRDVSNVIEKLYKLGQPDDTVIYGSLYANNATKQDVAKNVSFYGRNVDGNIINLITEEIYTSDVTLIPWFFAFKTTDVPLYYIVPNIHTVQIPYIIEDDDHPTDRTYTLDSHLGSFNKTIFYPALSNNAKLINETNIMVKGNTLTIDPFAGWFAKSKLKGFFDPNLVKCSSSYEYTKDENGLHFNINTQSGYIIIRWNTISAMGYKFMRTNRFHREFVVTQIGD